MAPPGCRRAKVEGGARTSGVQRPGAECGGAKSCDQMTKGTKDAQRTVEGHQGCAVRE